MNAILAQSTIRLRREILRQMTGGIGLGGVYAATLEWIMGQDGDKGKLGMGVLMWVSRSERPLRAEELCQAMTIEESSTELDSENVPAIETLLSCCLGLATIDERRSRVRLIHVTLQEYLGGRPDLFGNTHSKMADVCLTYLNFQSIKDLPLDLLESPETMPFLGYASCYWGVHVGKESTEHTKSLALQLLDRFDHHVAAMMLQVNRGVWTSYGGGGPITGFTGLHAIAYFGVAEIATALIRSGGWEVNARDSEGVTPLMWAVKNNNAGVCQVLLELGGADPNAADNRSQTPLHIASASGREDIVKLLLERKDVNPNSSDVGDRTPLHVAAQNGQEGIVKLFLERKEVNPGSSNKFGLTPLSGAASCGHEGIVKLLLELKEVNPGSSSGRGETPLLVAAFNGHEGTVKLLLERKEVNPDARNYDGKTPLLGAAWRGREGIAKLLLERKEVNPGSSNSHGETPLLAAAWGGHEGVAKMLLERKEVNPDSVTKRGCSPLWGAAWRGHEGIIAGSPPISLSLIVGESKWEAKASGTPRVFFFFKGYPKIRVYWATAYHLNTSNNRINPPPHPSSWQESVSR